MKYNIDKIIAGAGVAISSIVSFLGVALVGLLGMMALDLVTGTLGSKAQNEVITSKRNQQGIIKKAGVLASVAMGAIIDFAIPMVLIEKFGVEMFDIGMPFMTFFTIWGLYNEVISITENLIKMGVPVPRMFVRYINDTKNKLDEIDNGGTEEQPENDSVK